MGGLSMNPDNHGVENAPRLAIQIAKEEEYLGLNRSTGEGGTLPISTNDGGSVDNSAPAKKPPSKFKIAGFELDTTYPRTIPGFVRIVQVLMLVVSFICLLLGAWPEQGPFAFYCIFLVFGALISAYLLFTVMAGTRGKTIFGITWRTVELVYFIVFGLLIFIGACLAANKSQGHPALNAAAAFGFFSVITFGYYVFVTWKLVPAGDEESGEGKSQQDENGEEQERPPSGAADYRFEMLDEGQDGTLSRQPSGRFRRRNSLPLDLSDGIYQNGKVMTDEGHRRGQSASDKDSAYSEGTSTPTRKMAPQKMRRTGSGYDLGRHQQTRGDFEPVDQRQPLSHLSHRPHHGDSWRERSTQGRSYGYPDTQRTRSFTNPAFEVDDLHRQSGRRKSMPEWLRTALGEDVVQESMVDDESIQELPMQKSATLAPQKSHHQFPLLNMDEEESICYPSVSQNGMVGDGGRMFSQTMPSQGRRRTGSGGIRQHSHHHGHLHRHHSGRGRRLGGKRHHHHSHHHGRKGHHHGHHRGRRHHGDNVRHTTSGGRRAAQEDYMRRMMTSGGGKHNTSMQGFQPMEGRPIETGVRRVIPEQPEMIQFPDQSRWDDDTNENPVMTKYFADAQLMHG